MNQDIRKKILEKLAYEYYNIRVEFEEEGNEQLDWYRAERRLERCLDEYEDIIGVFDEETRTSPTRND